MFEVEYKKKCKDVKDAAKAAETHAKTIKFFRYDMFQSLELLEEQVLEAKCVEEPIKASKIDDYAKEYKDIRPTLKAVQWNLAKLLEAWKDLDKLEKSAGLSKANIKNLKDIKGDIVKFKKRTKGGGKLDPAIVKLEKQIDEDLKEINDVFDTIKKIPSNHRDPEKIFAKETKDILNAKPRLSAKAKKFQDLYPKMLIQKVLKKKKKECEDTLKAMKKNTDRAVEAVEKDNAKGGVASWEAGKKDLLKIQQIVKAYTKIKDKHPKELNKAQGKKKIMSEIANLEKIEKEAEKGWDVALEKINNYTKVNKKKEKEGK